jgi:hypothetical protein
MCAAPGGGVACDGPEHLDGPSLAEFRAIDAPSAEVLFACNAMVLLCGADLARMGVDCHDWMQGTNHIDDDICPTSSAHGGGEPTL